MNEDQIQMLFMQWLKEHHPSIYVTTYHIPNGGKRSVQEGKKFKQMGVKKGVADIYFMHKKTYMELKTVKGKLSDDQKQFREHCKNTQHGWFVAYGFLQAIEQFNKIILDK